MHRVLVVEDDDEIRAVFTELLTDEGYIVEAARDGLDALHRLEAAEDLPSVVLLDLMMPRMDGFEFLAHVRRTERLASVRVLVVTAIPGVRVADAVVVEKPLVLDGDPQGRSRTLPGIDAQSDHCVASWRGLGHVSLKDSGVRGAVTSNELQQVIDVARPAP